MHYEGKIKIDCVLNTFSWIYDVWYELAEMLVDQGKVMVSRSEVLCESTDFCFRLVK